MKKYNFLRFLKQLSVNEYQEAMNTIPQLLEMTQKHWKYNILNANVQNGTSLRVDQLIKFKNYLLEKYPKKFKRITLDDLVNEPHSQAA